MRAPTRWVSLLVAAGLLTSLVEAATIVPPRDLGELTKMSDAIVLARALSAQTTQKGRLLFTDTSFEVLRPVAGELARGARLTVEAPGGELGGIGWAVPGSPRFATGTTYLLFLNEQADGTWQPRVLSYGLLEQVRGRDGANLLVPMENGLVIDAAPRRDGATAERVGSYQEAALLGHLSQIARGAAAWDSRKVLARASQLPLVSAASIPSACTFMTDTLGRPIRWTIFDSAGSTNVFADATGDNDLGGGGASLVSGAVSAWMGVPSTSLNLSYGGTMSYSMTCTSDPEDTPDSSTRIVMFNDPCNDIADLSGCVGTLAFGGPWFSGTHTFDGQTWRTAISWFVVVNNGVGLCLSTANYQRMLTHELGHGLGFDHYSDSSSLMYYLCCNDINSTDRTCAQYAYPPPGPPNPPANVQATDGLFSDRVRVTWNSAPGATSYEVWRNTSNSSGGASLIGSPGSTSYDDLSATPGTTFWYWVKAHNAYGTSGFSSSDSGFAVVCSAPGSPTLSAPPSASSGANYTVTWTATSPDNSYEIQEATAPDFSGASTTPVSAISKIFNHVVAVTTTFYYRVRAIDNCGGTNFYSAWSAPGSTQVIPCSPPATPSLASPPQVTSGQVYSVLWSGTSPDNSYELQESTSPTFAGATTTPVAGTSASLSHTVSLTTTFYYRVRAAANCGGGTVYSGWSTTSSTQVIPCPAPATPVVTAPAQVASGQAYTVSWTATSPSNSYELQESTDPAFTGASTTPVTGTSTGFNHTVAVTTTFYSRVRAAAACPSGTLYSAWSAPAATQVVVCGTPATPAFAAPPSANAGATYTLLWAGTSPDNTYEIQEATDPGFAGATTIAAVGTSKAMSHNPPATTTYYSRCRALDECLGTTYYSAWSTAGATQVVVACTSPAAPSLTAPANAAMVAGSPVTLSWSAAARATSYDVYFGTTNPPPLVANVTTLTYQVAVTEGQTCYWRIQAKNACGQADSPGPYSFLACSVPGVPGADFSWSPAGPLPAFPAQLQPFIGQLVQLTDVSTNSPTAWTWYDFQTTGVTFHEQNPAYAWSSAGIKTVRLMASNCAGTSAEMAKQITVYANIIPKAAVLDGSNPITNGQSSPIDLGTVIEGGTGPSHTFKVRNDGGGPLVLSSLAVPAGFALLDGLASSLPPGGFDTFTVQLQTTSAGVAGGNVTFTTNDPDAPQLSFAITGTVNPPPPRRFDFGTATSPVAPGFTGVTPATAYSAATGFGWLSGSVGSRNRTTGTDLTRDFNYSTLATFALDLPNGRYEVTVWMGDMSAAHDQMGVFLEGTQVDSVTTAARQILTRTYIAKVTDGQLTLLLDDLGGNDANAVINALDVSDATTWKLDFGTTTSPVAAGYTRVASSTRYSAARGWGWASGTVGSRDRATGSDLARDFNYTANGTFAVDVPAGTYNVTVFLGDQGWPHDQMRVSLEGTPVATISTAIKELSVTTYQVGVADGQLTVQLADLGGSDPNVAIAGLEVAPVPPPQVTLSLPGDVPLVLVRVPPGAFQMGSPDDERGRLSQEGPLHKVSLTHAFFVGRDEVTQAQWQAIMGGNPASGAGVDPELPVYNVSWMDIAGPGGFIEKLNQHLSDTGQRAAGTIRLPSEAEWERAARAATGSRFFFGDNLACDDACGACAPAESFMWWCANTNGTVHTTGAELPNSFGLFDMSGNVGEWVADWYGAYSAASQYDPTGPASGSFKVFRGGGSFDEAAACRSAHRDMRASDDRTGTLGFRLAKPD